MPDSRKTVVFATDAIVARWYSVHVSTGPVSFFQMQTVAVLES